MNRGNHPTDWLTTYPFPVFGHGWEAAMPERWPHRGDTVVTRDVPPYALFGRCPAGRNRRATRHSRYPLLDGTSLAVQRDV